MVMPRAQAAATSAATPPNQGQCGASVKPGAIHRDGASGGQSGVLSRLSMPSSQQQALGHDNTGPTSPVMCSRLLLGNSSCHN
jgi:hypothetical protein